MCVHSDRCNASSSNHTLKDGRCLGKSEVRDCAEVAGTRCTGSLSYPNADGTACQSWVFVVLVIVGFVLIVTFDRLYISMRMKEQNCSSTST